MSEIREALATLLEGDESFAGVTQQMITDRMVAAVAAELAQDPIITEAVATATFAAAARLAMQARDRR